MSQNGKKLFELRGGISIPSSLPPKYPKKRQLQVALLGIDFYFDYAILILNQAALNPIDKQISILAIGASSELRDLLCQLCMFK